jgi:hypothetical protein
MGKEVTITPEQQATLTKTLEDYIARIKPLKSEAPSGNWVIPTK